MTDAQTLTRGGLTESQASIDAMESAMSGFNRTTLADLLTQQETLMSRQKDVSQIDDAKVRAARLEIINSDMSKLQAKIVEYRDDTAELIAGLEAYFEKLGVNLSALQKPTQEDLQIVKRAVEHLANLERDGPTARALLVQEVTDAESSWNPLGKAQRVQDARDKLAEFELEQETDISDAKTAVEEAKAEIERLRRKRIREAEFDSQFERFITMTQQIQAKLLENVKSSEVRIGETQKALTDALKQKEGLGQQLNDIDTQIKAAEDAVMALEQERSGAIDQAVRASVETRLGAANQVLADLNGTKQEMQVAFNAFESAAKKHEEILATIQVQRDNQRAHARKLSIDSKARFQQAQNLVNIIKNSAQEDAAARLHTAGSSLDRMSLETAARTLIASERIRLEMLRGHERDMKSFDEVTSATAEGRAKVAIEDAEIAERMRKNYGIDPLGGSWLHLAENMGGAGTPATP